MVDSYQKPYLITFNAITDALEALESLDIGKARTLLKAAQQRAEEAYLSGEETK